MCDMLRERGRIAARSESIMCPIAWFLLIAIIVFCIPVWLWLQQVKRDHRRAKEVLDHKDAIMLAVMREHDKAIDIRAQARKERDQWKVAKIMSNAKSEA
jgi:hypothetical protein